MVPQTISPHYFVRIFKVSSMLYHGPVGRVHSKKYYFIFTYSSLAFFVFRQKICFYHFRLFFWWSVEFPQQNINQSETKIGDEKLSVELYALKRTDEHCVGEALPR